MDHVLILPFPRRRRSPRGSSLLVTLIVVLIIVSFISVAASVTSQFGRLAGRQQGVGEQVALADSALEYSYGLWKTAVQTGAFTAPAGSVPGITPAAFVTANPTLAAFAKDAATGTAATGSGGNGLGVTVLKMQAWDLNANAPATILPNGKVKGVPTQNVPGYPGWSGLTYGSLVEVTVTSASPATVSSANPGGTDSTRYGNPPPFRARRYFQMTTVPLFQAAIFYQNRLEIHPGADMTVFGLVHSNDTLEAQGFARLLFKSNVSSAGLFSASTDHAAAPYGWDGYGYGSFPNASQTVSWSTSQTAQYNQVNKIDPFGGATTANNGLHDMIETPPTGTDPLPPGMRAYSNAGLRVEIDSSRLAIDPLQVKVTDGSGNALSTSTAALVKAAVTVPLVATTSFYDGREAANVRADTVDMAKLNTATAQLGASFNGLIHIRDVAPNVVAGNGVVSAKPALRLINGRNMPSDTTIASDNPVYLQGDFNTGGSVPSDVPANQGNPNGDAQNYANGYSRSSCAIMADAVTILSNSWNDANSTKTIVNSNLSPTGNRVATPTTVNAAILAGDIPTNYKDVNTFGAAAGTAGNRTASGGVHNFTRFLENWSNVDFTYWGSLVEGFVSEKATGKWQTGQVYTWPDREWNFDTNFLLNPPPGTPSPPIFSRGRWERF